MNFQVVFIVDYQKDFIPLPQNVLQVIDVYRLFAPKMHKKFVYH